LLLQVIIQNHHSLGFLHLRHLLLYARGVEVYVTFYYLQLIKLVDSVVVVVAAAGAAVAAAMKLVHSSLPT